MRIPRSGHFWLIIALFVLCCILHYAEQIGIMGTEPPSGHFGLTRHALERILFLVPIIYSAYVFGLTAGLFTCLAALAAMLPRAIFISPALADALLESGGIAVIGVLASLGLWRLTKEKEKAQAYLGELQSAHKILQQYVQFARASEKRLTILNAISGVLGESLEPENVLRKAVQMVSELMEVEVALIYSLDEETGELMLVAYEGVSDEFAQAVGRIKVGEGLYGEVAKTGQAIVVEDASHDPRMTQPEVAKMRIQIQLIVPLAIKDRVRGTLCVAMRRPREFTNEDIELLTAVGTQIATALENAYLYDRERIVAKRLAVSERNLWRLFENASDAIWVQDLSGNIIVANQATENLTGYSVEELIKMNASLFLPDEGLNVAGQVRRKLLEREPVEQPYEQRLVRKDGTEAILKLTTGIVVADEKPTGFQHIARDVTEEKRAEEVLKESERRLSQIVDGSSVPTFVINREHTLTHWNKACENLTGVSASEVVGTKKQWLAFYTEERPVMADLIVDDVPEDEVARYYGGKYGKSPLIETAYEAEDFFPHFGERGKWLFFTAAPLRDHEGKVFGAIETLQDTTERKRADEALKESESRYRDLFSSASDAIIISDLEGNIVEVNEAASDLTGYAVAELAMMNVRQFLTAESFEIAMGRQRRLLNGETASERYELEIIKKDGKGAIIEAAIRLITQKGQPVAFHNIARDVTEERRMQDNLRYYLQEITRAQEEERKRIARELHDDTAQALYALNRQVDNFVRSGVNKPEDNAAFFRDLNSQVLGILDGVRRFGQDLRPPMLDDLGLLATLRWLVSELKEQYGIETDLRIVGVERRFAPEIELLLFRVVQEAMNNIGRHSQARKAEVSIEFGDGRTSVSITDNGVGFQPPESLGDLSRVGKLGFIGMQERVRLLGGSLTVQSDMGKGTTVIVDVPL